MSTKLVTPITKLLSTKKYEISRRTEEIKRSWSNTETVFRAELGKRLQDQLYALVLANDVRSSDDSKLAMFH